MTFDGSWHRVPDAGLNPLPVQRPISLWFGGGEERVLRRIARLADGWMPQFQPDEAGRSLLARMHGYAREHGRDPAAIGLNGRIVSACAASNSTSHCWNDFMSQRTAQHRARGHRSRHHGSPDGPRPANRWLGHCYPTPAVPVTQHVRPAATWPWPAPAWFGS